MISVIICTRDKDISAEQRRNIKESARAEVEIVVIDNSKGGESIFSAYNKGVCRANGDILCFMHDDVMFRTEGWEKIARRHFEEDEKLGLIGFAGTHFLPSTPMYWHDSPFISEYDLTTRDGETEKCFFTEFFSKPDGRSEYGASTERKTLVEVAAVDGLCFFVRRELFDTVRFDEETFDGFHLYDMDICMQVRGVGYKVAVCNDILVEHFYNASPSKKGYDLFEKNLQLFYNKWSSYFPMVVGMEGMTEGMIVQLDRYVKQKLQADKAYSGIYHSKAYRLGKALLIPLKRIKH
jgi:GT2 family glycosyltransferase